MYIILFALFAFLGGMASSLLGWLASDPPETFNIRKFLYSAIKAFTAALVAAGAGAITPPVGTLAVILMCIAAFLAGAGADAGIKRAKDATSMIVNGS